jgi:hypothetical protein
LGFESGKKTPSPEECEVILGWGCKPGKRYDPEKFQQRIASGKLRVLNSVEAVQANRDKLGTLLKLGEAGVSVPGLVHFPPDQGPDVRYLCVKAALEQGALDYPLIAHNRAHKGYPYFCFTLEDVAAALSRIPQATPPLDYMRSFCPGKEFRIHVFRDTVLGAQVKLLAEDPVKACANHLQERLAREIKGVKAPKGEVLPTPAVTEWLVKQLAEEMLEGPNHLQRSVTRGWELKPIGINKVPTKAITEAVRALEVAGLDLGAVSVTVPEEGKVAQVTTITTSPSLQEKDKEAYVGAILEFCEGGLKPRAAKKAAKTEGEKPSREMLATLSRKIKDISREEAEALLRQLGT